MSSKLRPLAALAMAMAIVALISAGCSSPSADTGADTGAGSGAGNPGTPNHDKAVKFSECMRSNGVSAFPDPDASGRLTIDQVANGSGLNPDAPAFKHALAACKGLEPGGFTGPKRTPQQQANALKFAECIRANGVPDFPDPTPDGPLVDTNRIPSANSGGGGLSILNAAMQKCRGVAATAGVTR